STQALLSFPTRRSSDLKKLLFAYDYMGRRVQKSVAMAIGAGWDTPALGLSLIQIEDWKVKMSRKNRYLVCVCLTLLIALGVFFRSEEHTSELQSRFDLV